MFQIQCDGQPFNPCNGMNEQQARACYDMYTGPQASKGHRFALLRDGKPIDSREASKTAVKTK